MKYVIPFNQATSSSIYGGKANKLIDLYQNGFHVPNGAVLDSNAFELLLNDRVFVHGNKTVIL